MPNTTAGINLVAEGFPWQAGDNVVTLDDEFPANVYPWMNLESRGVEVRVVRNRLGPHVTCVPVRWPQRKRIVA